MALTPYVPAYWTNRVLADTFTSDPCFSQYPASPGWPTAWAGGVAGVDAPALRVAPDLYLPAGSNSPWAMQLRGGAGADAYANQGATFSAPISRGWYVLYAVMNILAGTVSGAGILAATSPDQAFSVVPEIYRVNFSSLPAGAVMTTLGPSTGPYLYTYMFRVTDPTSHYVLLGLASHLAASFGSNAVANNIHWDMVGLRPATAAEIAAGNQLAGGNLPIFPALPGRTLEIGKSPMFSSKVAKTTSGRRRATSYWAYPTWQFELPHEVIRAMAANNELAGLLEFFNTILGRGATFLYLDPDDNQVLDERFGTGDGTTTAFQLTRAIRSWLEPVIAPFGQSIYVNGVLYTEGVHYTLSNGVVTFGSAPAGGAALTWSGYFYFVCAMSDDTLSLKQILARLWNSGLKFESVRP